MLLLTHLSTASQSNSERRGHGHVCVCSGKPEGHGAHAEGAAGPGEDTLSVLCSKRELYVTHPGFILVIYLFFCLVLLQSEFCGDKPKSGAKYNLPDSLAILSEMGEVTDGVMDSKVRCRKLAAQFDLPKPNIL